MRKVFLFLIGICIATVSYSWSKCEYHVNTFGIYGQTCKYMSGPAPKEALINYGTPVQKGDIRRVTKNSDGSVSVERYGHEGERDVYRETAPGTWERR